jgi:hypothetical protein
MAFFDTAVDGERVPSEFSEKIIIFTTSLGETTGVLAIVISSLSLGVQMIYDGTAFGNKLIERHFEFHKIMFLTARYTVLNSITFRTIQAIDTIVDVRTIMNPSIDYLSGLTTAIKTVSFSEHLELFFSQLKRNRLNLGFMSVSVEQTHKRSFSEIFYDLTPGYFFVKATTTLGISIS